MSQHSYLYLIVIIVGLSYNMYNLVIANRFLQVLMKSLLPMALVKACVGNRLEKREKSWKKISRIQSCRIRTRDLISSQTILPLTQVVAECRKMAFP